MAARFDEILADEQVRRRMIVVAHGGDQSLEARVRTGLRDRPERLDVAEGGERSAPGEVMELVDLGEVLGRTGDLPDRLKQPPGVAR
jgi:hypothetical protein